MFSFIKKLLGLPTEEEKKQALESKNEAPYKVEPVEQPVVNNKSGEVVDIPKSTVQTVVTEEVVIKQVEPVKVEEQVKVVETAKVEEQKLEVVQPVVEEKPVKKARKPAKPKVEKEKGAEKSAPEKVKKSKSKKV